MPAQIDHRSSYCRRDVGIAQCSIDRQGICDYHPTGAVEISVSKVQLFEPTRWVLKEVRQTSAAATSLEVPDKPNLSSPGYPSSASRSSSVSSGAMSQSLKSINLNVLLLRRPDRAIAIARTAALLVNNQQFDENVIGL